MVSTNSNGDIVNYTMATHHHLMGPSGPSVPYRRPRDFMPGMRHRIASFVAVNFGDDAVEWDMVTQSPATGADRGTIPMATALTTSSCSTRPHTGSPPGSWMGREHPASFMDVSHERHRRLEGRGDGPYPTGTAFATSSCSTRPPTGSAPGSWMGRDIPPASCMSTKPTSAAGGLWTADRNRDGIADILMQHASAHRVAAWLMDRVGHPASFMVVHPADIGDWKVVGRPILNRDGVADILMQHASAHGVAAWLMDSSGTSRQLHGCLPCRHRRLEGRGRPISIGTALPTSSCSTRPHTRSPPGSWMGRDIPPASCPSTPATSAIGGSTAKPIRLCPKGLGMRGRTHPWSSRTDLCRDKKRERLDHNVRGCK